MAELDIGQHCGREDCKQLDFLPIKCQDCGSIFCKLHSFRDDHHCSAKLVNDDKPTYSGPKSYQCDSTNCHNTELTAVTCPDCKKNYCLEHRHQVDHDCALLKSKPERMSKTTKHVSNILLKSSANEPKKKRLTTKAKATAAKVNLMKLKMKSTGKNGLPESERIYFQVFQPLGSKSNVKFLFVSKLWTIGRIIDYFASESGLKNENNTGSVKKLKLFDLEGDLLETDKALEYYLTSDVLFNGSDVILEYVEESITQLTDVSIYKSL